MSVIKTLSCKIIFHTIEFFLYNTAATIMYAQPRRVKQIDIIDK